MCVLGLDEALKRISEDLSTPSFKITFTCPPEADTEGSFFLWVETPEDMSEEEANYRFTETGMLQILIEKLCDFYPEARKLENGLDIPELGRFISWKRLNV